MTVTPPVVAISGDMDWADVAYDCGRTIVKYSVPIKIAATNVLVSAIENARQYARPGSDMFLRLVAFLVPIILEFFLAQLAYHVGTEVPNEQEQKKATTQSKMWEAETQRQRWADYDRKQAKDQSHGNEAMVNSWSLDDGFNSPELDANQEPLPF